MKERMAGIQINDLCSWDVAGWVHTYTVDLLLKNLAKDSPYELVKVLRMDQASGLGYFSLRKLRVNSLTSFLQALDKSVDALNSGAEAFGTPSLLPEYLNRLHELQDAVRSELQTRLADGQD